MMPAARTTTRRVVIAGVGLVTPLGFDAWATYRALLDGRSIAGRAGRVEPGTDPVALAQAVGHVAVARRSHDDPAGELAERALREACGMAGVEPTGLPTWLGTSKGAVAAVGRALQRPGDRDAALAVALGPQGYLSHRLAARAGVRVKGHHVAACASSLTALDAARRWLQQDARCEMRNAKSDRVLHRFDQRACDLQPRSEISNQTSETALVVTAEAALLPAFLHSYRRLGVLSELTPELYRQAPLDASRAGFMLAELGAAVLLKALPEGERPAPGDVELLDTAVASEAYDMVRPSPSMAAVGRVAASLFAGRPVDVLHPHAPGTADHDPAELRALADALNAEREPTQAHRPVDVYAVKGALGHGLGAAGLVSLVVAWLGAKARRRPPMPWLTDPMTPAALPLRRDAQAVPDDATHAVFAAGFGGPTAGAILRRCP